MKSAEVPFDPASAFTPFKTWAPQVIREADLTADRVWVVK